MTTPAPRVVVSAEQLNAADRLIASGRLDEAAAALTVLATAAPADPRPHLLGIRLAEACNNAQAALDAAQRAVQLAPAWSVAAGELAFLLARLRRAPEAMAQASKTVAMDSRNPQVLARMVDVAHLAQDFGTAVEWLRGLEKLSPADGLVKRLIARDLHLLGRHAESVAAWGTALAIDAADREALMGRMQAAFAQKDTARALRDCEALLALDPANEEYQFWHAVAEGRTPPTQPARTVRNLFDGFADLFDQHIVQGLKYQLPREVAQQLLVRFPDRKFDLLDLGCGTGLLGMHLGRINGNLVGVDVSPRMIEQAARHQVYGRFDTAGLAEALQAAPDRSYDVIAALDVFVYVGDLGPALPQAIRVLRPGGLLVFSCESAREDEADLVLRPSLRYAHKQSHVEARCRAAGFGELDARTTALREENHEPVNGFVITVRKPA